MSDRYARQSMVPEVGAAGQARLTAASVLVVGAGGLGCAVLQYLAAAGVGRLVIVDHDRVEESNVFDPPVAAALRYAELATSNAHAVTDELFAELRKQFSNEAILELTCVIGLSNYFNRFMTALHVDLSESNQPYDAAPPVR